MPYVALDTSMHGDIPVIGNNPLLLPDCLIQYRILEISIKQNINHVIYLIYTNRIN